MSILDRFRRRERRRVLSPRPERPWHETPGNRRGFLSPVRDPRAFYHDSVVQPETASGVAVDSRTSLRWSPFYRAVALLSGDLAKLPLLLYWRNANGGKRRAIQHPTYRLLKDAWNEELTSFEAREFMVASVLLRGNGYAALERDGAGRVIEAWPLRPDQVRILRDSDRGGELVYEWRPGNMEPQFFRKDAIHHLRNLSLDGVHGLSIATLARETVGLGLAGEEFGARFFSNDATPGGVLTGPAAMSDPAYARLKASWSEAHEGVTDAHKVAILEEGFEWKGISIAPKDAEWLAGRKFGVTEVARWFGIPPHKLADMDRATFSNIEEQAIEYVSESLLTWARRWEQAIQRDFLRGEPTLFAEFLFDQALRGKTLDRFQAYGLGRQWGWLSVNDIRKLENLDPIGDEGDLYLHPLNMVPADAADAATSSALMPQAAPTARSILRTLRRRGPAAAARRRVAEALAPLMERMLRRIGQLEVAAVEKEILATVEAGDVPAALAVVARIFDPSSDELHAAAAELLEEPYATLQHQIASLAAAEVGRDAGDLELSDLAVGLAAAAATRHLQSSRGRLERLLEGSAVDPSELGPALRLEVQSWTEHEGRAAYEGLRNVRQGEGAIARDTLRRAGVTRFRWVASGDNCPMCSSLNGKVVGAEASFVSTSETLEGGEGQTPLKPSTDIFHPPLHRGCDCSIVAEGA